MDIKRRYEIFMTNKIDRLEIKCHLLALVTLFGTMAGIEKKKKGFKIGFIISDVLFILDLMYELFFYIKEENGRGKNE